MFGFDLYEFGSWLGMSKSTSIYSKFAIHAWHEGLSIKLPISSLILGVPSQSF